MCRAKDKNDIFFLNDDFSLKQYMRIYTGHPRTTNQILTYYVQELHEFLPFKSCLTFLFLTSYSKPAFRRIVQFVHQGFQLFLLHLSEFLMLLPP
jgi:hypothetical protein